MTTDETKRPPAATTTTTKHATESGDGRTAPSKPSAATKAQSGPRTAIPAVASGAVAAQKREAPAAKKALTYEKRMRSLAPIVQVRRKVESTMKRFANLATQVRRWKNAPDLREAASKVETALVGMLAEATTTPDTFQPERERKTPVGNLTPGTIVALREKVVGRYDGVLEAAERAGLEIVTSTRTHVSVKTATGLRIVVPRAHLTRNVDSM
jgi:hypothetical protein